jgi:hypothetical protein
MDGAPVRTIGRPGAGPGEFGGLAYLGWRGDTLTASDPLSGRLQMFDAAGKFLSGISFPVRSEGSYPVRLLDDGSVLGQNVIAVANPRRTGRSVRVGRWDRKGKWLGDIVRVSRARSSMTIRNPEHPRAMMTLGQPFSDDPLLAFAPDGSGFEWCSARRAGMRAGSASCATLQTGGGCGSAPSRTSASASMRTR